jgi:hypothetical protein
MEIASSNFSSCDNTIVGSGDFKLFGCELNPPFQFAKGFSNSLNKPKNYWCE